MKRLIFIFEFLLGGLLMLNVLTGCSSRISQIDQVYEIAGENRSELEKVLYHYKGDPQKRDAAEFLIANMAHRFPHSKVMDTYQSAILSYSGDAISADSIWLDFPEKQRAQARPEFIYDARVVTADYLINHIEQAFQAWQNAPWSERIDFSTFCRYILPYRVTTEPLSEWREILRERYLPYIDGICTPDEAFVIIYNRVFDDFKKWSDLLYPYTMTPLVLNKVMRGRCEDRSLYLTCVLRALAIPAAYDYLPFWGNVSAVSHSWVSYIQNDSTFTLLHGSRDLEYHGTIDASRFYQASHNYDVNDLPFHVDSVKRAGSAYRACFEIQPDRLEFLKETREEIPVFFIDLFQKNVSREYGLSGSYRFKTGFKKNIYLCGFKCGQGWSPLFVTKAIQGEVVFDCLDKNVVYLVCTYQEGKFMPLAPSFYITEENELREFIPDENRREEITLHRKYTMTVHWTDRWSLFLGGKFEGSDFPDFRKKELLHEITEMSTGIEKTVFATPKKYRYIRFIAREEVAPNFAEFAFYGKRSIEEEKETELNGRLIGDKFTDMAISIERGTDWDYSTFFRMSYQPGIPEKGYWFGYDLGEDNDYLFAGVGFCPNSDQNMIEPGDLYELFYFKDQWISLGQQMASNNHLIYDNAPVGALLWLRNLTKGKEERVFTYENKKQIWW